FDGLITFTVIPCLASSTANDLENDTTAAFAAAYAEIVACPKARSAPTAPRFTIRPQRCLRIGLSAALHARNTLSRFDDTTSCHSWMVVSDTGFQLNSPTLFTRISSRP